MYWRWAVLIQMTSAIPLNYERPGALQGDTTTCFRFMS